MSARDSVLIFNTLYIYERIRNILTHTLIYMQSTHTPVNLYIYFI